MVFELNVPGSVVHVYIIYYLEKIVYSPACSTQCRGIPKPRERFFVVAVSL